MDVCNSPANGQAHTITKEYSTSVHSEELYLNTCYPIEISTTQGGRSMGHCMDFIQYVYYAGARLNPVFNASIYKQKVKNCPKTVFLHGEYPIDTLFDMNAINYWMPNVEQVQEEQRRFIQLTTKFIAKTRHSKDVLLEYLSEKQLDIPVLHFGHSSLDPLYNGPQVTPNYNAFFHSFGHSGLKGTRQLLECWEKHPEWPKLTVVGNKGDFLSSYPDNIQMIGSMVSAQDLRVMQLSHGVHLCPSIREGFGHYINQARASKALVVTTDFGPMNEFVSPNAGVLIKYERIAEDTEERFLPRIQATISPSNICSAVEQVLRMSLQERKAQANLGRADYEREKDNMILSLAKLKSSLIDE